MRFLDFFKKLFGKKEPKKITAGIENTEEKNKPTFLDEIKVENEKNSELVRLQKQYERGEVNLYDLPYEQVHELRLLYERQVTELKKTLEGKKVELKLLQNKAKRMPADGENI